MPRRKPIENKHARPRRTTGESRRAEVTPTTFPASEITPGQARSRAAFGALERQQKRCKWWPDFLRLMQESGLDWRKAAYIAWAASPLKRRWPPTIKELAEQVLGCSDRVVRKWRELNPALERLIAQAQVAPLMEHRRDVIDALVAVASTKDSTAHSDRKLFLEMTGDYRPRAGLSLSGPNEGPIETIEWSELARLNDDELDRIIHNLEAAIRGRTDGEATPAGGEPGGQTHGSVPTDLDDHSPAKSDPGTAV